MDWLVIISMMTIFCKGNEGDENERTTIKYNSTTTINTTTPQNSSQETKIPKLSWIEYLRMDWTRRNNDEGPGPERGPIRDAYYNPTYGFEPYWQNGGWVHLIPTPSTTTPTRRTTVFIIRKTKPPVEFYCGISCGAMYRKYGAICARNNKFEYRSFSSYCGMKSIDCEGLFGWRMLYQGTCRKGVVFYRTLAPYRYTQFINNFTKNYKTTFFFVATYVGYPVIVVTQGPVTGQPTADPNEAALEKFVNKFLYDYDPEVGYEPYWADGEVVLHDPTAVPEVQGYKKEFELSIKYEVTKKTPEGIAVSKEGIPLVCGEECLEMYRSIRHVCTHDTRQNNMQGCWRPPHDGTICTNIHPDTFVEPFKEFPSYCAFLDATCRIHYSYPSFVLLHVGKCKTENYWYKPLDNPKVVLGRLTSYSMIDLKTEEYKQITTFNPLLFVEAMPANISMGDFTMPPSGDMKDFKIPPNFNIKDFKMPP